MRFTCIYLQVSRDSKDDSGRFSGLLSSSGSPRIGFSRSSSRLSFQDDLDDCDFSCPFIVDDVDDPQARYLYFFFLPYCVCKIKICDSQARYSMFHVTFTFCPLKELSPHPTATLCGVEGVTSLKNCHQRKMNKKSRRNYVNSLVDKTIMSMYWFFPLVLSSRVLFL